MKPGYKPSTKDVNGFHIDPASGCCGTNMVYYNDEAKQFVLVTRDGMPSRVVWRCDRCSREIDRNKILQEVDDGHNPSLPYPWDSDHPV